MAFAGAVQRYASGLGTPLVLAVTDHVTVNPPAALTTHVGIVGARVVNAPTGTYVFHVQRP